MEPEEIDKIFKDRLAGVPATPSADAWMRLQQKMEPPKKARSMWIYYAAATVTLLIISGVLFFARQSALNTGTIAKVDKPKASNSAPSKADAPIIIPEKLKAPEGQIAQAVKVVPEEKQKSTHQELKIVNPAVRANKTIIAKAPKPKKVNEKKKENKALLAANTPTLPTSEPNEKLAQVNQSKPVLANALTANVVEVRIIRDTPKEEERSDLRENLVRKTSLLKNIYKQARNLKNGEQVELTALGINTDKINSEKKELKEKINKVISL